MNMSLVEDHQRKCVCYKRCTKELKGGGKSAFAEGLNETVKYMYICGGL